jgi:flagellar biosynthetic protein FliR
MGQALQLLPADLFGFLLVFSRVGAALMVMPAFGESYVPSRIRLALALGVTLAVLPSLPARPPIPDQPAGLALLIGGESLIGAAIGLIARLLVSALNVAGAVIGLQSGLSFAQFYDPTLGGQNVLIGALLSLIGLTAIFATDLHLPMIQGIADSYTLIRPGAGLPLGDLAEAAGQMTALAFSLGLKIASPFIVYGILFGVGSGVLARLMPQIQISFIAMPLQLLLSFALLASMLPIAMLWFLDRFAAIGVLGTR